MVIVVGLLVTIPLATQLLVLLSTVAYVLYDDWTVKQCFEFCSVLAGIFRASAKFGAMDPPIMFCSKCRTVLVWTGILGEILVFWERQAFRTEMICPLCPWLLLRLCWNGGGKPRGSRNLLSSTHLSLDWHMKKGCEKQWWRKKEAHLTMWVWNGEIEVV